MNSTGPSRRRVRGAQDTRERRRRYVTMGLSIALVVLLVNALVGENGYLATIRARSEHAELESSLAALRLQNQRLQEERKRLETDPAALEEAARRSLNLVRPGETLVIVRDAKTPASK